MKPPSFLVISLAGNLILAAVLALMRGGSSAERNAPPPARESPATLKTAHAAHPATETPKAVVPWSLIESEDYRQYIANLRAAGCPDWLVRDMIVADIDDLYEQKTRSDPVYFSPWQGEAPRSKVSRSRVAKLIAARQEKRALVKALLGYEWDNHANEAWKQDFLTSLTLGFLPEDKVAQVLLLKEEYTADAQNAREDANYILIDEDRARLQTVYEGFEAAMSQLLNAPELDELELRAQKNFLTANDIHFEGLALGREDLRELVRLSKKVKDLVRDEFVPGHPVSEAEQARSMAAFEAQVETLLGPKRFADYQRAQDAAFREIFEFSQQNNLPQTAAVKVYEIRRNAGEQANGIQKDGNLSAEERATALAVLKAVTTKTVSSVLGGSYQSYLEGSGQWLETLAQPSEPQTQKQ